jgi:hypothetical protein
VSTQSRFGGFDVGERCGIAGFIVSRETPDDDCTSGAINDASMNTSTQRR